MLRAQTVCLPDSEFGPVKQSSVRSGVRRWAVTVIVYMIYR
jgi:hypothetical protein